jgi:hypothetical protein
VQSASQHVERVDSERSHLAPPQPGIGEETDYGRVSSTSLASCST